VSNSSYENLHKLVDYLLKKGIIEAKDIAKLLGMSLKEFITEFMEK
jgi:predicted HTH domain antitoxin